MRVVCPHFSENRVLDPFDERRFLCGDCGELVAEQALLDLCREQLMSMQAIDDRRQRDEAKKESRLLQQYRAWLDGYGKGEGAA